MNSQADPLKNYRNKNGTFHRLPGKKQKKKLDAMIHDLAQKFEPNKKYSEQEVNLLLLEHHSFNDPATLRRLLFGMGLMNRTKDGRAYWLT